MAVDPTPTSDHLPRDSKEAVRGGTRTKFNLWVLVFGTLLVVLALFGLWALNSSRLATTEPHAGNTPADAAVATTQPVPAQGDTPVEGESVTGPNAATTPSQESPRSE